jgi:hypothetical protein
MNVLMTRAPSTGPLLVRPRAEALLVASSGSRITLVSTCAPEAAEVEDLGVPSRTMNVSTRSKFRRNVLTSESWHNYTIGTYHSGDCSVGLRQVAPGQGRKNQSGQHFERSNEW